MGMFDSLFGKGKVDAAVRGYFRTLTAYQPVFYSRSGGLYEMDATRAAINAIATQCAKLKPNVSGSNNQKLERALQFKPNPWQNTYQWLYRTATILEVENTAFLVPVLDRAGAPVGVYTVLPQSCSVVEDTTGRMWLRYEFARGQHGAMEWEKVGVLTKMQYKDDLFGSSNAALKPTLDLLNTQTQGIQEGIKQGAAIRFMAKLGQTVRPDDLKKEQKAFAAMNLSTENSGGVMMFDTKYADVKQIDSKAYIPDANQMSIINGNIYNYYGVNEKVLRNEPDEATWSAFYEGKIEPFALQLGLTLTSMFFTEREIAFGSEVTLSANRLQYVAPATKLNVVSQLFDRGLLSTNEAREILQMSPIEGGDVYMIRGEYVNRGDKTEGAE